MLLRQGHVPAREGSRARYAAQEVRFLIAGAGAVLAVVSEQRGGIRVSSLCRRCCVPCVARDDAFFAVQSKIVIVVGAQRVELGLSFAATFPTQLSCFVHADDATVPIIPTCVGRVHRCFRDA